MKPYEIKDKLSLCERCAFSTVMKRDQKQTVYCGAIKGFVPDGITECSDYGPIGSMAYSLSYLKDLAVIIDVRSAPGQTL